MQYLTAWVLQACPALVACPGVLLGWVLEASTQVEQAQELLSESVLMMVADGDWCLQEYKQGCAAKRTGLSQKQLDCLYPVVWRSYRDATRRNRKKVHHNPSLWQRCS